MKLKDIKNECLTQKWVPLVVFRRGGKTILPLFESTNIARRFAERNFSKEWLTGAVNLNPQDEVILGKKGIIRMLFKFPTKLKDTVEFDIEIHEFDRNTEVEVEVMKSV
jgi:hypothetical protein